MRFGTPCLTGAGMEFGIQWCVARWRRPSAFRVRSRPGLPESAQVAGAVLGVLSRCRCSWARRDCFVRCVSAVLRDCAAFCECGRRLLPPLICRCACLLWGEGGNGSVLGIVDCWWPGQAKHKPRSPCFLTRRRERRQPRTGSGRWHRPKAAGPAHQSLAGGEEECAMRCRKQSLASDPRAEMSSSRL
jgi:hypothetical protein